jgi:enoyl-CoA hydratase/carnithine racemase
MTDPAAADHSATPASDEVRYVVSDAVATLTIDRPARRNALSWDVVRRLRAYLAEAQRDPEVRVVVLTGAGDVAFCSGADLGGMRDEVDPATGRRPDPALLHDDRGELAGLFEDLYALGKPTIARVFGYCLAGGFGLALACDLVVAADDAVFATPEIDVGIWPYMITVPLCRSMPPKKALELMMTGRRLDAVTADDWGFVTRVVPVEQLDAAVAELAGTLASKPPTALRLGRDSFYAVWDRSASDALALLHPMLGVAADVDDAVEGVAAFLEKRPPSWRQG